MKDSVTAFHASLVDDPLFAAEGMDLENAHGALDELETSLRALEAGYAEGSLLRRLFFTRYPLARYAVPLTFLRAFVESEKLRRAYLAEPSLSAAHQLISVWRTAARALTAGARRYGLFHRILVRLEAGEDSFVMEDAFGFQTSYRDAERAIGLFARNGAKLIEEVSKRRSLLEGAASVRRHPKSDIPELRTGTITPWNAKIQDAAVVSGTWPYRYTEILEKHGPLRFSLANFDGTPTEHTFLFYLLRDKKTSLKSMWPALVDQFYFLDIWGPSQDLDDVTRGAYATSAGVTNEEMPYWYEPATCLYNSRDCTYWMDIATIVDAVRRPNLERNLVATERSSMYDLLLVECARDVRSMTSHLCRRRRSNTARSYSLLYDLLTRSFPGAFYLPFNASVWRLDEKPRMLGERFSAPGGRGRLSEDREQRVLTPDMLKVVMSAARLREERGRAQGWLP